MIPIWLMLKLKVIGYFLWDNKKAIAIGIVLILALVGLFTLCGRDSRDKKAEQIKEQIIEDKVEANVIANQKEEIKVEVNNAQNNSNIAANNFNNVVRRDSNAYNGANATDKFCRRFPGDSSCAEWRRLRGMQ
jgi:hypothetical protein